MYFHFKSNKIKKKSNNQTNLPTTWLQLIFTVNIFTKDSPSLAVLFFLSHLNFFGNIHSHTSEVS